MTKPKVKGKKEQGKARRHSHNKLKVGKASSGHGFAVDRKRGVVHKFKRKFKTKAENDHSIMPSVKPIAYDPLRDGELVENAEVFSANTKKKQKVKGHFKKAEMKFATQKQEKLKLKQTREASRREHEKKVKYAIQERKRTAKKIMKRTKWGQPFMANQIDVLLGKIKKK